MTFLKNFKTVPAGRKESITEMWYFFFARIIKFFLLRGDGVAADFSARFSRSSADSQ